ncbi:MAG: aromatic-ring-hydroxylating dioxygenase subunit beta [Myxococcota bacterium]
MNTPRSPFAVDPALQAEIEQFLYHEAALLDEGCFEQWLSLMTPDIEYRMPVTQPALARGQRPIEGTRAMHFEDDHRGLRARVHRLGSKAAWSDQPPPLTRRSITNVRVEPGDDNSLRVRSNFVLYIVRRSAQVDLLAGTREDTLRRVEGSLAIARRSTHLDQQMILANPLSMLF